MARGGVSYSDIAKAAETIKSKGENPTVDRVLNVLGTGSKSTIGPHLKAWKESNFDQSDVSNLPSNLITAVKELHQRMQSEADSKVEDSEQKMATQKNEHSEDMDKLTNEINQLKKTVNELQKNKVNLTEDNKNLKSSLEKANLRVVQLESKKESDDQIIIEIRKTLDETRNQLKHSQEQQEHYQHKIAEERAIERNENQAIRNNLNTQIAEKAQQLNDLSERYSKSQKQLDSLSNETQILNNALHSHERDIIKKESIINSLKEKLADYESKAKEISETNRELNKTNLSQSNQISALSSECVIIKDYLKVAHKDIESIQSRYDTKTEEYIELRQEKNILEKQLITLQKSI